MKPHFPYNTIDAMGYLALSGKNEEVYDALEAFGSYYRILLSKGREMILVREEAEMVKDYLELQKLRYGDSLHYVLNVDPGDTGDFYLKNGAAASCGEFSKSWNPSKRNTRCGVCGEGQRRMDI